jgi:hypothetical protein
LQHRADLLERAAAFAGTPRQRARAMIFASCEFMMTHRDFFSVELMLQARSFWDRVSQERQSRHLTQTSRIFHVVHQLVVDAHACGDLPRSCAPDQVARSLMALFMGIHCMITQPAMESVCPAADPITDLLVFGDRLMDGWGWKPISNGTRIEALDKRILKELVPNSHQEWFTPKK